jgi:serpin B
VTGDEQIQSRSALLRGLLVAVTLTGTFLNPLKAEEQGRPRRVADEANAFAFSFYSRLRTHEGNLAFSPYSIFSALAWAYAGARGKTAQEMAQGLHLPLNHTEWPQDIATLNRHFSRDGNSHGQTLSVANALWIQQGLQLLKEYLEVVQQPFRATLKEVDFERQTESARQTINQWIENETRQKIKNLIPQGGVDAQTRAVLTNAIYFKGVWEKRFEVSATKPSAFALLNSQCVLVPMMHMIVRQIATYAEGPDWQLLQLPYKGEALSMVLILPRKSPDSVEPPRAAEFSTFEQSLTAQKLQQLLSGLHATDVDVALPKFIFSPELRLKEILSSLGMQSVFSRNADFSGIAKEQLFFSEVFHKTFIGVDEEGTEAAAATGIVMRRAALGRPAKIITFHADHPFLFLIRHASSGAILFMGRVAKPEQKG